LYHCNGALTLSCRFSPPSRGFSQSGLDFFHSLEGTLISAVGTYHPSGGVQLPAVGTYHAPWGVQLPVVGTSHPPGGVQLPAVGNSHPPGGFQLPVVGTSHAPWGGPATCGWELSSTWKGSSYLQMRPLMHLGGSCSLQGVANIL